MKDLQLEWEKFEKYADEHNQKQPGYPNLYQNSIMKDFRVFMVWLKEQDNRVNTDTPTPIKEGEVVKP